MHFREGVADLAQVLEEAETTLTCFLRYNTENTDGRHLLYYDFLEHYVYYRKKGEWCWTPRQRGRAIGRMYNCGPAQGERFYLRMLLTVVRGPTSFEAIRTVDTVLYPTFRAACIALGLLDDDGEWFQYFNESKHFSTSRALRSLFVTTLINGDLSEPLKLWERFCSDICDDLPRCIAQDYPSVPADFLDSHFDYGLFLIAEQLQDQGRKLTDYSLPVPVLPWSTHTCPLLITSKLCYDTTEQGLLHNYTVPQLNIEQCYAFNTIVIAVTTTP